MAVAADYRGEPSDAYMSRSRAPFAAINRDDEFTHRIRRRCEGETIGRPGPYTPDIDDGVKVNIRPSQEAGLLPAKVISKW